MKEEIDEEQVRLAERYADVLQDIKRLEKDVVFTEDDVDLADRYVTDLTYIEENGDNFSDDDMKKAEKYAATLQEIKDSDADIKE